MSTGPETLVTGGTGVLGRRVVERAYLEITGRERRALPVPIPGKTARAFREGVLTCPDEAYGEIRWEEFLRSRVTGETGRG